MQESTVAAPKLFISYSWSSPDHEQWVVNLSTALVESGVQVILDKWDLREGHDSISFMESMVTDDNIKKVAIITDRVYAEKADGRSGGVGTETQIISKSVYENQKQDKFVAIIAEKDDAGKPYMPTYYKGKIYIDLSEVDKYAENFDKLLRWVYDRPLYVRPELGRPPEFLKESMLPSLMTGAVSRRALDAIKTGKPFSLGATSEYLDLFVGGLENFRMKRPADGEWDDLVVENIDKFTAYRNEFLSIISAIAQYGVERDFCEVFHRFFEKAAQYMYRPENVHSWNDFDFDNYKFIVHELFLSMIAIFVRYERFVAVNYFMGAVYYNHRPDVGEGREAAGFLIFREGVRSLDYRSQRLKLQRLSLRADLLKERAAEAIVNFKQIMQADLLLYLRSMKSESYPWFPDTLIYSGYMYNSFEIFARSASTQYFNRVKPLLDIQSKEELEQLIQDIVQRGQVPRWQFESFNLGRLVGLQMLCTRP